MQYSRKEKGHEVLFANDIQDDVKRLLPKHFDSPINREGHLRNIMLMIDGFHNNFSADVTNWITQGMSGSSMSARYKELAYKHLEGLWAHTSNAVARNLLPRRVADEYWDLMIEVFNDVKHNDSQIALYYECFKTFVERKRSMSFDLDF